MIIIGTSRNRSAVVRVSWRRSRLRPRGAFARGLGGGFQGISRGVAAACAHKPVGAAAACTRFGAPIQQRSRAGQPWGARALAAPRRAARRTG